MTKIIVGLENATDSDVANIIMLCHLVVAILNGSSTTLVTSAYCESSYPIIFLKHIPF